MFVLRLAAAGDTLWSRRRARVSGGQVEIAYVEIKTVLESRGRWFRTDLRWLRLMTLNNGDAEHGVSRPSGNVQGGCKRGWLRAILGISNNLRGFRSPHA